MRAAEFAKLMSWKRSPPFNKKIKYSNDKLSFCLKSRFGGIFRCSFYTSIKEKTMEEFIGDAEWDGSQYIKFERINFTRVISHPHVGDDRPCLGGYTIPIYETFIYGEVNELIRLTQDFLNSKNEADMFYCRYCGYPDDDCECY